MQRVCEILDEVAAHLRHAPTRHPALPAASAQRPYTKKNISKSLPTTGTSPEKAGGLGNGITEIEEPTVDENVDKNNFEVSTDIRACACCENTSTHS